MGAARRAMPLPVFFGGFSGASQGTRCMPVRAPMRPSAGAVMAVADSICRTERPDTPLMATHDGLAGKGTHTEPGRRAPWGRQQGRHNGRGRD